MARTIEEVVEVKEEVVVAVKHEALLAAVMESVRIVETEVIVEIVVAVVVTRARIVRVVPPLNSSNQWGNQSSKSIE